MGADVINMSFGGNASSIAVQDALATAYSRCVLVASAGNDAALNEEVKNARVDIIPNYPAALSYVIGVMSVDSNHTESSYTNIDGALYTSAEYEVYAPGNDILSTIPGDRYAKMSGTSMAAPVVAAQAALLRSYYEDRNIYPTKFIYGQIVGTATPKAVHCSDPKNHSQHNIPGLIEFHRSVVELPTPDIGMSEYRIFDSEGFSLDKEKMNNGDGVLDAGETVALGFVLKNRWGMSENTVVNVSTKNDLGVESPYITVINNNINYGSVGTYSQTDSGKMIVDDYFEGWSNPFYLHISKDTPNNYNVILTITITYKNGLNPKDETTYTTEETIQLKIRRGVIVPYMIVEDYTLTKDNYYIIPSTVTVAQGATLTIEPGTKIQFWTNDPSDSYASKGIAFIKVQGTLRANGTAEEPIEMFPSDYMPNYRVEISGNGRTYLNHTIITNPFLTVTEINNCEFRQNYAKNYAYRSLQSNGTIQESSSIGKIVAQKCKGSAFYKLGTESTYSSYDHFEIEVEEIFEENIVVDSKIKFVSKDCLCNNNVFYGNNLGTGKVELNTSTISNIYSTDNTLFVWDYFTLSYTDNSYAALSWEDDMYGEPWFAHEDVTMDRFLDYIGAHYVSFNDTTEYYQVINNLSVYTQEAAYYDIHVNKVDGVFYNDDGTVFPDALLTVSAPYINQYCLYSAKGKRNIYLTTPPSYRFDMDLIEIESIYPSRISLNQYLGNMTAGERYQLEPITFPKNKEVKLIYESNNPNVVTVDENGLVTAVGTGNASIFIYSEDKGIFTSYSVNVYDTIGDSFKHTGTDYHDENVEILFSSTIKEANVSAITVTDWQGEIVETDIAIKDNKLLISSPYFYFDEEYTITIPANTVKSNEKFLDEELQITIWYGCAHYNGLQTDASIVNNRDRLTLEELKSFWSNFVDDGLNTRFYSNVILNRLNDDNTETWLRFFAPSTSSYETISLGANYWGTTNEKLINEQIVDYEDYSTLYDINHGAYLKEAPSNTYPFVVKAYLEVNGQEVDVVGNETVDFVVEFNRPMDPSIELNVQFGSAYPYADYHVDGSYDEDGRVWRGQMKLTTLIENGYQYWSVSDGKAANSNYKLYKDWGRFPFKIDTSTAQTLIMQAEVSLEGIQLTWEQDDYETLAGYNIYRSTSEDGYYSKINRTVIPANTKAWFDDTVEPGKTYYYNFTVVESDFTESKPSGKITVTSMDTMAPSIYHSPVYDAFTGHNYIVNAIVRDNLTIKEAKLYYRACGSETWNETMMTNYNDKYSAIIPSSIITTDGFEYYIEATDGITKTYKGSESSPYVITVYTAVADNAKGDVDGNGQITLQDAMKLLYAINDRYNMTAEEFARADLDSSGQLEAVEALIIIQYLNGTITSIPLTR